MRRALITPLLLFMVVGVSCTKDSSLDDGDSAAVVIQVDTFQTQPVTARLVTSTIGECSQSAGVVCRFDSECPNAGLGGETCLFAEVCVLEVVPWTVTLFNAPLNSAAEGSSPFNDVIVENAFITYVWSNPAIVTPTTATIGLGGTTIPVGQQNSLQFEPIPQGAIDPTDAMGNLINGVSMNGQSASLNLVFSGRTVEGRRVSGQANRELNFNQCF